MYVTFVIFFPTAPLAKLHGSDCGARYELNLFFEGNNKKWPQKKWVAKTPYKGGI
jgi:hypothetical protein